MPIAPTRSLFPVGYASTQAKPRLPYGTLLAFDKLSDHLHGFENLDFPLVCGGRLRLCRSELYPPKTFQTSSECDRPQLHKAAKLIMADTKNFYLFLLKGILEVNLQTDT